MISQVFIFTLFIASAFALNVTEVDFNQNATATLHKTSRYGSSSSDLIVRRGNIFTSTFTFTNFTDEEFAQMKFQLMYTWDRYEPGFVDIAKNFGRSNYYTPGHWSVHSVKKEVVENSTKITYDFSVPLNAAVGSYSLVVKSNDSIVYDSRTANNVTVYVLFNPYHKSDQVYMNSQTQLEEYLESDVGAVYTGSNYWVSGKQWIFGQYDPVVLVSVMKLLDNHFDTYNGDVSYDARTDPILFSRKVAFMVHNYHSNKGLMEGRWHGSFEGGVRPSDWTSSVPIFEKYLETNRPVLYSQCWVFAAVAVTVLRTVGVPSRPITTFDAAHNTQNDLVVHKCNSFNAPWNLRKYCDADTIWNFHSWAEAWMTRPDLCAEEDYCPNFSGWQVVDGTPQEPSEHDRQYLVGPSPKSAIIHGHVKAKYDSTFVFAEVAAPVVTWNIENDILKEPLSISYTQVGSKIVTKKLNSTEPSDYEDITYTYKSPDADWHRVALINAFETKNFSTEMIGHNLTKEAVVVLEVTKPREIYVGQNITLNVTLTNKHPSENQTVRYTIRVDSMYYTGGLHQNVMEKEFTVLLMPNETQTSEVTISFDDYYYKLVDLMHLNLITKLHAQESDYSSFSEEDFHISTPVVSIRNESKFQLNQPVSLIVEMTNSLPLRLTNCALSLTGLRSITSVNIPTIHSNETMHSKIVTIFDAPHPALFAIIDCDQLTNIHGSMTVRL